MAKSARFLAEADYPNLPKIPDPHGTLVEHDQEDKPRVGVWVMPNNTLPGKLEDFVRFLLPNDDVLWNRAGLCLQQIPDEERLFTDVMKAQIHTWLAWQKRPGLPMGQAITEHYLDANAAHARNS